MQLGEILLESGILSERQLGQAMEYSQNKQIPLGLVVKLFGMTSAEDLGNAGRTEQLIRQGVPPALAMVALIEFLSSREPFDDVLARTLQNADPDLAGIAIPRTEQQSDSLLDGEEDDDIVLWLDSPAYELMNNGDKFFEEQDLASAEQCFDGVRKRIEASNGEGGDEVTPVLRRLANLYMVTDRGLEAEELYLKIIEIKQEVNGEHHMSVATAFEDLGDLYYASREYQRAEGHFLSASTIYEGYLPLSLAEFVSCLKKLLFCSKELEPNREHKKIGTLLTEAGLLTEEQLLKALKLAKQDKVPLGTILKQECMIDELALQSFLEVQALTADGILSGEAASRAYKGAILAGVPLKKLLQDAGVLDRSQTDTSGMSLISALDDLIEAESGLGPNHKEVASRAFIVAQLHEAQGNIQDAENFYGRALNICQLDKKTNSDLYAAVSKKLGMLLLRSNRPLQAEPFLMESLELLQAARQAESLSALEILQDLAILHNTEQNLVMAWTMFSSAFSLASKIDCVANLTEPFLDAYNSCAKETQHEGDVEPCYMQTIRTLRRSATSSDRTLAILNMKLGDFYRDTNRRAKAKAQYEIAQKLLSRSASVGDKTMQEIEDRLVQVKPKK